MFTSYNFPKLENCIDKQLSQIGNISLVGDRALRAFLARAPRLADPDRCGPYVLQGRKGPSVLVQDRDTCANVTPAGSISSHLIL